jgi:hydroxyacylglutathione hydrolase
MAVIVDVFPARQDNYGYLIHDEATGRTAALDAPEAAAIRVALRMRGWTLSDIFITHHHLDHVEGIGELKAAFGCRVVGPRDEADKIDGLDELVGDGDRVMLGETAFDIIATPGHTLGHIVYHDPKGGHLFSADALFSLGVGRMFEGTPGPMWAGLERLRALPDETLVYCGHEYTESNAKFRLTGAGGRGSGFARGGQADHSVRSRGGQGGQSVPPRRCAGGGAALWPRGASGGGCLCRDAQGQG